MIGASVTPLPSLLDRKYIDQKLCETKKKGCEAAGRLGESTKLPSGRWREWSAGLPWWWVDGVTREAE
jgi:hypothetical protein